MTSDISPLTRLVAFYLPQFYPTPENDAWWGKGFTEWTSVTRARPRFWGHYQPHLPADLGFTDLRVPETRAAQAELAASHGIGAFCYYHYWFQGRRLLARPFDEVLSSGEPRFPFCLCWANGHWNRAWDGLATQLLIEQTYGAADDEAHGRWLMPAFADDRYLRVNGRPLFLVYHAHALPDPRRTTDTWREIAQREGIGELYLARVDSYQDPRDDPRRFGFDAGVEFQPDTALLLTKPERAYWRLAKSLHLLSGALAIPYRTIARRALARPAPAYPRFRGVTPGWDNASRRRNGPFVLHDARPEDYGAWLAEAVRRQRVEAATPDEDIVFVNAWNEWAEGNHLEPDQKWGLAFLEATAEAVGRWPSDGLAR